MKTNLKSLKWVFQFAWWAFLVSAVALGLPGTARAGDLTVDCNGGPADHGSISDALNALDLEGPHTITVLPSTCNESVQIVDRERLLIFVAEGDDVTITPPSGEDGITILNSRGITIFRGGAGGIFVGPGGAAGIRIGEGSQVHLNGLVVQGNFRGVVVEQNSTLRMEGALIQNNASDGLLVTNDSFARFQFTNFWTNGGSGIHCRDGSVCFSQGEISSDGNQGDGMTLVNRALARMFAGQGPNRFLSNGFDGIFLTGNCVVVLTGPNGNIVQGNNGSGITGEVNSAVALLNTSVTNNTGPGVAVLRNSVGEFFNVLGPNTISGNGGANLTCDSTSLLTGDLGGFSKVVCTRVERTVGPPRPGRVF